MTFTIILKLNTRFGIVGFLSLCVVVHHPGAKRSGVRPGSRGRRTTTLPAITGALPLYPLYPFRRGSWE